MSLSYISFGLIQSTARDTQKPEDIGAAPEEESSDEELSEDDYAASGEGVIGKPDP